MSILDEELLRQIKLVRYQNGEIDYLLEVLEKYNLAIANEIKRKGLISTKKIYNDVRKHISTLSKELRNEYSSLLDVTELIENEILFQKSLFEKFGIKDVKVPNANMIKTAVQFRPFIDTANFESFLDSIQTGFYNAWDNAVRLGYITGETSSSIVKRVMGSVAKNSKVAEHGTIETLRNSVERNTRTYLQSMASEARLAIFEDNDDFFEGYQYIGTLDRRTCLVCGNFDNKLYESLKDVPRVPIHYNCRCTIVPVIKGMKSFTNKRSSSGGYVDESMDYAEWLETQDEKTQKYILGKERFEMYERGEKITSFVNNGRVLNINEL